MRHILFFTTLFLFAPHSFIRSQELVISFSGNGGKNTRPFNVSDEWEIRWDVSGDIFQLFLYSSNGELVGVAANQSRSGKGSSYQPKAGRYYLQVNALGDWTVDIVSLSSDSRKKTKQKENRGSPTPVATFSGNSAKNTRPFVVSDEWEIRWNAEGDIFQLFLYSSDGDLIGVPANQSSPGTGSSYQTKGGKYYLQVNALGSWQIEIVQIE
jgi:hypothetical protein